MRPLIVDLGKTYRGGQHQALLLLEGLLRRGHAPHLIAVRDSTLAQRATGAGFAVHVVPASNRRLAAALQIRRLVRRKNVDIVHANEPHALTSAWLARAHRTAPVIAARRIALPLSSAFISRAKYSSAARIIAVSHFVEKSVVASGLPPNRIQVIYDGVEIPLAISPAARDIARAKLRIPNEIACLGNVGALVPEKGHAILLRAFAELVKTPDARLPQCRLMLAGEGPERENLLALARTLKIEDRVNFLASISDPEVILAAMDVFVFPSHEEPLGSVLLLAMAHSLPVVAFARGGVPEFVKDGENGLLVNDLDAGKLAATVASLLADPEGARRMGDTARQTIIAGFSADKMVDETLGVYEQSVRTN